MRKEDIKTIENILNKREIKHLELRTESDKRISNTLSRLALGIDRIILAILMASVVTVSLYFMAKFISFMMVKLIMFCVFILIIFEIHFFLIAKVFNRSIKRKIERIELLKNG